MGEAFSLDEKRRGYIVSTVRFRIYKSVADGLHLEAIKRHARAAMVTDVRLAHDEKDVAHNEVRVTCSMPMAIFFVEAIRHLSERATSQRNHVLVADCARASSAAIRAIEKADRAPTVIAHAPMTSAAVEHRV
jgi:hypothetical protein